MHYLPERCSINKTMFDNMQHLLHLSNTCHQKVYKEGRKFTKKKVKHKNIHTLHLVEW